DVAVAQSFRTFCPTRMGTVSVSATDCTAGSARKLSINPCQAARDFAGLESAAGEMAIWAVNTLWISSPGFSDEMRSNVRPMIPAEVNKTNANAIWHATKPLSGLRAVPAIVRDRERR